MSDEQPQTYGENIMRMTPEALSVAQLQLMEDIKYSTAAIIDLIKHNEDTDKRLAGIAVAAYESAAMWAIKLVTTVKQE